MLAAVSSSALALLLEVRADRSLLPWAISTLAFGS
jgi:hypothetical protein